MQRIRALLVLFLCAYICAPAAHATWSVVVINKRTGEVCIASATCLADFPLRRWLPVVVVGKGAGAAQSFIDTTLVNRTLIWNALHLDAPPERILEELANQGSGHETRQYGLVSFFGPAATFTGLQAGEAKFGVTGDIGDLTYAIQGNVLTDAIVVTAAEQALLDTDGDMATKVMAAMIAARDLGGDGRCSCSQSNPTGCGAPPPNFTKAAHTAFIIVARMGDTDGGCDLANGCSTGTYYLRRQYNGSANDPDPVLFIQNTVAQWRAGLSGVPDHILTRVTSGAQELVADGLTSTTVHFALRDIDDVPITVGGHTITIAPQHAGPAPAIAGALTDHGDGTYSFDLTATSDPGLGTWEITVNDGMRDVLLWPPVTVDTMPPADFHASWNEVSAAAGAHVTFTLAEAPGRPYRVLGSLAGTSPGTQVGSVLVPLNQDRLFGLCWSGLGPPYFANMASTLDGQGRAQAVFHIGPDLAWAFVGDTFHFGALWGDTGGGAAFSSLDSFLVSP